MFSNPADIELELAAAIEFEFAAIVDRGLYNSKGFLVDKSRDVPLGQTE